MTLPLNYCNIKEYKMKNFLLTAFLPLMLAVTSCGPVTFTLPVERMTGGVNAVDFQGTLPGVVSLVQRGDSDSALLSALAVGIAERLEADLGLDSGAVPVYSMYADEVSTAFREDVEYLHAAAGVEFLIVADSMYVGEFSVEIPDGKAYLQGGFMQQTVVSLPYNIRVQVFDSRRPEPVTALTENDIMEWTLLSDTPLTRLRAVERVNSELGSSFRTLGGSLAERFLPGWETVNKMLYVYDDNKWNEACRLAYLFEWEKAMEIWYGEADSPDVRRAACAAHNLSVACEILELNDMAAQWKARSEELMNRSR